MEFIRWLQRFVRSMFWTSAQPLNAMRLYGKRTSGAERSPPNTKATASLGRAPPGNRGDALGHNAQTTESSASDDTAFLERDAEDRADVVWEVLIGAGRLKRDKAIVHAAKQLRERGLVAYGRLQKDGNLYQAIWESIRSGIESELFEERGRGYVRAVAVELDPDDWLQCLKRTLSYGPLAAESLPKDCAQTAQKLFGLKFKRLRKDGKIMKGIHEAIQSAQRDGTVRLNEQGDLRWAGAD